MKQHVHSEAHRMPDSTAWVFTQLQVNPGWIAGFVDGEGCFTVDITQRSKIAHKITIGLCFSISQHKNSAHTLYALKQYFQCGNIVADKNNLIFRVKKFDDLRRFILPYFAKYPLITQKRHDLEVFQAIFAKMNVGLHLSPKHLPKILEQAYSMNMAGKRRKHSLEFWLHLVSKSKK